MVLATDPNFETNFAIGPAVDPCDDPALLLQKAERCRRLAAGISDKQAAEVLKGMAQSYIDAADRLAGTNSTD